MFRLKKDGFVSVAAGRRFPAWLFLPLLCFLLCFTACGESSNNTANHDGTLEGSSRKQEGPSRRTAFTGTLAERPPADAEVVEIRVPELFIDMESEKAEAILRRGYDGRWVELTGRLGWADVILASFEGEVWLSCTMEPGPEEEPSGGHDFIVVVFRPGHFPWRQATAGDMVTVRGIAKRMNGVSALVEAEIVEGGSPALEMTLEEMTELYEADREAFIEQYDEKEFILFATFAGHIPDPNPSDREKDFGPERWLAFEKENGELFYDSLSTGSQNGFAGIQPGDEMALIGAFHFFSTDAPLEESVFIHYNVTPFYPDLKQAE